MFGFLKKIFGKEEEISEEKIRIDELGNWFNDESKKRLNRLDNELKINKDKINEEIEKTKQNLEALKNAELRNPKIPFRAKQMMEGNREAYIKRVHIFLKQIDLEKEHDGLLDFCNSFDGMLTDFGKSTIKTYHVLQEFFANESRAIAGNIRNLGNLVKEIKNRIGESNIELIKGLKEEINGLNNKITQREDNKRELEKNEKEKEKLIQLKKDIIKNIEGLKKSDEYKRLEKLESEQNEVIEQINGHKNKLLHSFSIIETALKKFSRMAFENEKLIEKYLGNPLFLTEDRELKIPDILKSLEKNLLDDQIQLKDRKKEKTLEEIRKMNKEFFDNFLQKYRRLNEKLENIKIEIGKMSAQDKINGLNNKRKENELKLEGIDRCIENLKKDIEKEQIDRLKEKINGEINNVFNVKVTIS